jgi:hypothetical protein
MLITYIGGGYWGNKIFGADQNRRCCPVAVVGTTGAGGKGPRQKSLGPPGRGLRIRLTTPSCKTNQFRNLQHGLGYGKPI